MRFPTNRRVVTGGVIVIASAALVLGVTTVIAASSDTSPPVAGVSQPVEVGAGALSQSTTTVPQHELDTSLLRCDGSLILAMDSLFDAPPMRVNGADTTTISSALTVMGREYGFVAPATVGFASADDQSGVAKAERGSEDVVVGRDESGRIQLLASVGVAEGKLVISGLTACSTSSVPAPREPDSRLSPEEVNR